MSWIPPAKRSLLPEATGTVCSRWLRFLNRKDPTHTADVFDLLREFGDREGFSLVELDRQFREEETRCNADDAAKRRARRA